MVAQVAVAVKLGTLRQIQQVCEKAQAQKDKRCDDNDSDNHGKFLPALTFWSMSFYRAATLKMVARLTFAGCALTDAFGIDQPANQEKPDCDLDLRRLLTVMKHLIHSGAQKRYYRYYS